MSHERLYRWIQDTQPRVVLTCAHVNPRLPRRVAALQAPCVEQTPPGFAFELLTVGAATCRSTPPVRTHPSGCNNGRHSTQTWLPNGQANQCA